MTTENSVKASRALVVQSCSSSNSKVKRRQLSATEVAYWLHHLSAIVKVGSEFEFDLKAVPEELWRKNPLELTACQNKRTLLQIQGDIPAAPLGLDAVTHDPSARESCSSSCMNIESCLDIRKPYFCENFRNHPGCAAKKVDDVAACQTCPLWGLKCRGSSCNSFTPYCLSCPSYSSELDKMSDNLGPDEVRQQLTTFFQPTKSPIQIGKKGIFLVTTDGSLANNGVEIVTSGRRYRWQEFYDLSHEIIQQAVSRQAYVDERCGQHFHLLTPNGGRESKYNELERPIPEIVLANFQQLVAKYTLAIVWISMAGTEKKHLTRWFKFRYPSTRFDAAEMHMSDVFQRMCRETYNLKIPGKYTAFAYHYCEFNAEKDLEVFHVENRISDALLTPSGVAAFAALNVALLRKAIRLSQYGVLTFDKQSVESVEYQALINNLDGGWNGSRHSDTSLASNFFENYRAQARELLRILKAEFQEFPEALPVLSALAEKPCALRLIAGQSWEQIESDLAATWQMKRETNLDPQILQRLLGLIDLCEITDVHTLDEWKTLASRRVLEEWPNPPADLGEKVTLMIDRALKIQRLEWDESLGCVLEARG